MKKLIATVLLLPLCLLLCACPGGEPPAEESNALVLTSPKGGTYVCEETGVTYTRRPAQYLPMTLSREPYAVYTTAGGARFCFFSFSEGTEKDYLMLADEDDLYPYYVIAAEDYKMPTLPEMDPYQIIICNAETEFFWLTPNIFDQVRTIEKVKAVVAAYEAGEDTALPVLGKQSAYVELIFASATYADFAYTCTYIEYENGDAYIKETETGLCRKVQSGLFEGFRLTKDEPK